MLCDQFSDIGIFLSKDRESHRDRNLEQNAPALLFLDHLNSVFLAELKMVFEIFPIEEEGSKCCSNRSSAPDSSIQVDSYSIGCHDFSC